MIKGTKEADPKAAMDSQVYETKIAVLLEAKGYEGAAALQYRQLAALEEVELSADGASEQGYAPDGSETEHSDTVEQAEDTEAIADTRVLKMLYKANMEEISRQDQQSQKA